MFQLNEFAQGSAVCILAGPCILFIVAGPQPLLSASNKCRFFPKEKCGHRNVDPVYECFLSQTLTLLQPGCLSCYHQFECRPVIFYCRLGNKWGACLYMLDDLYFIALMRSSILNADDYWWGWRRWNIVRLILWLIPLAVPSLEVYYCDHERGVVAWLFQESVIEHVVCTSVLRNAIQGISITLCKCRELP